MVVSCDKGVWSISSLCLVRECEELKELCGGFSAAGGSWKGVNAGGRL